MKQKPIKIWGLWDKQNLVFLHPFFRTKKEVIYRFEEKIAETEKELGPHVDVDFRKEFIPKEIIIN